MRIGNIMDLTKADAPQNNQPVTNYSKADFTTKVKIDIAGIGKDTDFMVDQGRSLQDVMDTAGALDVQTTQDYMTVMSNTMSEEDYAAMMRGDFDPADMTGEESATILDHIKAVMAESGRIIVGFNDDQDIDVLKEVTGNVSEANALAKAMKQADLPISKENADEIDKAAKLVTELTTPETNVMRYMIDRGLPATFDNMYKASHSGASASKGSAGYYSLDMSGYLAKKSSTDDLSVMDEEIKNAVKRLDIDDKDFDEQVEAAKWLVANDLNVSGENINAYIAFQGIEWPMTYEEAVKRAADSIAEGRKAADAVLYKDHENIYDKAVRIFRETEQIKPETVDKVLAADKTLNLKNLIRMDKANIIPDKVPVTPMTADERPEYAQNARLTLEETRLRMTIDINVSLLKKGMPIDTVPLTQLVEGLKAEQENLGKMLFKGETGAELTSKAELIKTTQQAVKEIPFMPAAVIGRLKLEEEYSLTRIHEAGTELKAKYEAAGQSYEALMTTPRKDMGDSITKAWQNVDNILEDMNIALNDENRKAVRILAYNSMEITQTNVEDIREAVYSVNEVIKNLTPEKTLELIREGINPMDMNINDLSAVLGEMKLTESNERYARFLYKAEKSGGITEEERNSYIGIYRFINKLEKTDGAAIGAMISQNRDITFRSLISGMRSKRADINVSIDDDFGFLDSTIRKGVSITDQIESAFLARSGEEDKLQKAYDNEAYREYREMLVQDQTIYDRMPDGVRETPANAQAYRALTEDNVFKKLVTGRSDDDDDRDELTKVFDRMVDSFEDRESAMTAYENMCGRAAQYAEKLGEEGSYIDLKTMMMCSKQLTVAGTMSRQEDYMLPMYKDGEYTTIRISFLHDRADSGRIDVRYAYESVGEIRSHLRLAGSRVEGMIVCETRTGKEMTEQILDRMNTEYGYTCDIRVVEGRENVTVFGNDFRDNTDINNVDTKSLYRFAKSYLAACMEA